MDQRPLSPRMGAIIWITGTVLVTALACWLS